MWKSGNLEKKSGCLGSSFPDFHISPLGAESVRCTKSPCSHGWRHHTPEAWTPDAPRLLRFLFPSALGLDVQIGLVEHLAFVELEQADAFARLHLVFARGGIDLRFHLSAEIFLLVLHA